MKLSRLAQLGTVAAVASLALAGCSSSSGGTTESSPSASSSDVAFTIDPSLAGTITSGGSSAQANAQAAWTSAYNATAQEIPIRSNRSGTASVRARLSPRSIVSLDACEDGWCHVGGRKVHGWVPRSEEHTSELQSH